MKSIRLINCALAAASGAVVWGSAAMALESKPTLTLDLAKKMAAGCETKATQEKWKMNIAVVDDGGSLVFFEHQPGAFKGSVYISQQKAITSANFPFPTRAFGEIAFGKDGKPGMVPGIANVPGIITFAGGLPIMAGGVQIGAIGVSGGTADQDEECSKAGLDAVSGDLK
jgi:glc operon protein GlcG